LNFLPLVFGVVLFVAYSRPGGQPILYAASDLCSFCGISCLIHGLYLLADRLGSFDLFGYGFYRFKALWFTKRGVPIADYPAYLGKRVKKRPFTSLCMCLALFAVSQCLLLAARNMTR
jgi:hypothetical protein